MDKHSGHLDKDILKSIPRLLDNPIAIVEYKPGTGSNTVSIYGEVYVNGKPVVVGVVVAEGRGGNVISKIRTVHARSDIKKQITDESILYLRENKKEVNAWFQAIGGINVPLGGTQLGAIRSINLDNIITPNSEFVKRRFSLTDLDTYDDDGNIIPLSERFNPESVDIRNALSNTEALEELVFDYANKTLKSYIYWIQHFGYKCYWEQSQAT